MCVCLRSNRRHSNEKQQVGQFSQAPCRAQYHHHRISTTNCCWQPTTTTNTQQIITILYNPSLSLVSTLCARQANTSTSLLTRTYTIYSIYSGTRCEDFELNSYLMEFDCQIGISCQATNTPHTYHTRTEQAIFAAKKKAK